jgi:hypothetical protein
LMVNFKLVKFHLPTDSVILDHTVGSYTELAILLQTTFYHQLVKFHGRQKE